VNVKKALIIGKYLVKNYVVNPFLKKFKKEVLVILLFGAIIGSFTFLMFGSFSDGSDANGVTSSDEFSPAQLIRIRLIEVGLTKHVMIDIFSSVLMVAFLLSLLFSRAAITVREEAEYEFLLAQPIDMKTYMLGRTFSSMAQFLPFVFIYICFIPFAIDISGGNVIKALFTPVALFLFLLLFPILEIPVNVIKIMLTFSGKKKHLDLVAVVYLLIAVFHSLTLRYFSPLLTIVFRPVCEAVVYCFTITETVVDVLIALFKQILFLVVVLAVGLKVSDGIYPENVKPLSVLIREKQAKKVRIEERMKFWYKNPDRAIFNYVVKLSVFNVGHVRKLSAMLVTVSFAGYVIRVIIASRFNLNLESFFISMFLIPYLVSMSLASLVNFMLASDFPVMWIYRVYARRLNGLAKGLTLKYVVYLTEAFLVLSVLDASMFQNFLMLLLPVAMLPLIVVTAPLVIAVMAYFASKRKIIKQAPTGLYVIEETVMFIIWIIIIPFFITANMMFIMFIATNINALSIVLMVFSSLGISLTLYFAFSKILTKILEKLDLAS